MKTSCNGCSYNGKTQIGFPSELMELSIRQAMPPDTNTVAEILGEAGRWLQENGVAIGVKTSYCRQYRGRYSCSPVFPGCV